MLRASYDHTPRKRKTQSLRSEQGPKLHEMTGNNFRAWLSWVEILTTAARRVRDEKEAQLPDGTELMLATNGVYAMLVGYAIECALKGLWVRSENKIVVAGRCVNVQGAGDHELGQLARAVGRIVELNLSSQEANVLDRLSAFVIFAGRYPIPMTAEKMAPISVPGRGKQVPHVFMREDFRTAELLLNRFTTKLSPFTNRPKG